jgi:conjugal transfer/type IV secretion protein DotA/TraY
MRFFKMLMLLSAAAMASTAIAAPDLMPTGDDKSVGWFLQQLFGGLVTAAGGPAGGSAAELGGLKDPLLGVIAYFNGFVLLIGGLLLAYTLVSGTMQTAHDGEVLGKKWSSMWVPIRTSLGISLIVPVFQGYAAIQVIVMWLVLQGVGAANEGWQLFTDKFNQSQSGVIISENPERLENVVNGLLKTLVCVEAVSAELLKKDGNGVAVGASNVMGITVPTKGETKTMIATTATKPTTTVLWKNWNTENSRAVGCGGYDLVSATIKQNVKLNEDAVDVVRTSHKNGMNALEVALKPYAKEIAKIATEGGADTVMQSMNRELFATTYIAAVQASAETVINDQSKLEQMKSNMKKDGWLLAGAWYVAWARYATEIRSAITAYPSMISPKTSNFSDERMAIETALKLTDVYINKKAEPKTGLEAQNLALIEESDSLWTDLRKKFFSNTLDKFVGTASDAKRNPILVAEALGEKIIGAGAGIMLSGAGLGAAFTSMTMVMTSISIGAPVLLFGMMLAYYIPFLPFILWMGGVVGWLVMVIEAVIAAPLWALAHLYPDADGVVGRGGRGYSLMLSLLLRPLLMIVGLSLSIAAMWPLGYFLHTVFVPAFNLSQGGTIGFFGIFAGIGLYTYLLINLITKTLSLIHMVPDQILKWMGGESSQLGHFGESMNQGMQAAAGAFVGAAAGKASSLGQAASNMSQLKEAKGARVAQETQNAMQSIESAQRHGEPFKAAGLKSADGVVGANKAGLSAQTNALKQATEKLSGTKAYKEASPEGKNNMQWDMVKSMNNGKNVSELGAEARDASYEKWAKEGSRGSDATIPKTYGDAMDELSNRQSEREMQKNQAMGAAIRGVIDDAGAGKTPGNQGGG